MEPANLRTPNLSRPTGLCTRMHEEIRDIGNVTPKTQGFAR